MSSSLYRDFSAAPVSAIPTSLRHDLPSPPWEDETRVEANSYKRGTHKEKDYVRDRHKHKDKPRTQL